MAHLPPAVDGLCKRNPSRRQPMQTTNDRRDSHRGQWSLGNAIHVPPSASALSATLLLSVSFSAPPAQRYEILMTMPMSSLTVPALAHLYLRGGRRLLRRRGVLLPLPPPLRRDRLATPVCITCQHTAAAEVLNRDCSCRPCLSAYSCSRGSQQGLQL